MGLSRGHRGEAVPQPRRGSSPPPQSEPKMAAGAAAAERRRRRLLGREGGRERRAPRAPPPPTSPSPRPPPRPSRPRLGRRSAHARPHAPDRLRARRSLSPRPPPSAAWRARRPVGARSGAPARTAPGSPSAPVRTVGRGPSRVPSAARAPASSSSTASSFLPPFPAPTATNRRHGRRRRRRPPTCPPPLARAPPTIPPAGPFHSRRLGSGRGEGRRRGGAVESAGATRGAGRGPGRLTSAAAAQRRPGWLPRSAAGPRWARRERLGSPPLAGGWRPRRLRGEQLPAERPELACLLREARRAAGTSRCVLLVALDSPPRHSPGKEPAPGLRPRGKGAGSEPPRGRERGPGAGGCPGGFLPGSVWRTWTRRGARALGAFLALCCKAQPGRFGFLATVSRRMRVSTSTHSSWLPAISSTSSGSLEAQGKESTYFWFAAGLIFHVLRVLQKVVVLRYLSKGSEKVDIETSGVHIGLQRW